MYYLNNKHKSILHIITKFSCIKKKQLKDLTGIKHMDPLLSDLIKQGIINVKDDIYFVTGQNNINKKVLKALDIYVYLNSMDKENPVEWCELSQFPFVLTLFRNNKVYDLAVIDQGEETSFISSINRSIAERVIVVIENPLQIEKIKTEKELRICIIEDNDLKFYEI